MSQFRDNADLERFELEEEGAVAFANYRDDVDGRRALLHFETPAPLRGRGVAGRLMKAIADDARVGGRLLRARCAYAVDYLQKHPEIGDVLE